MGQKNQNRLLKFVVLVNIKSLNPIQESNVKSLTPNKTALSNL